MIQIRLGKDLSLLSGRVESHSARRPDEICLYRRISDLSNVF